MAAGFPRRFGRYWLQQKIGHGGMAEIFRASIGSDPEHYQFDLVIKRLHAHLEKSPDQVDMFLTEADVAKLLKHPNILRVYEAGVAEDRVYIAMEYIWGSDLAQIISRLRGRRLPFPPDYAVHIALEILRGLDYVHQAQSKNGEPLRIVHRDVNPTNIYVSFKGEVKLGDFGVAHVSFLETGEDGMLKGKVAYMPPELLKGASVDQGIDVWSVAVTLYEMLANRRLLQGVSEEEIMAGRAMPKIDPIVSVNPHVEPELAAIVDRALHIKPSKRPASAAAFYRQLKRYAQKRGIDVKKDDLGSFVRMAATHTPAEKLKEPVAAPAAQQFETEEYYAPMIASPTRRFRALPGRSRRRRVLEIVAVAVFVIGLASVAMTLAGKPLLRFGRHAPPVLPVVVVPPPEPPPAALPSPVAPPPAEVTAPPTLPDDDAEEPDAEESADASMRLRDLLRRGTTEIHKKRFDAAERTFRTAIGLRPKSVVARLGLGRALFELQQSVAAEDVVNGVLRDDPGNARAFFLLGSILRARGELKRAREAFEQAIAHDTSGQYAKVARQILAAW